jgi:hypothetical protein
VRTASRGRLDRVGTPPWEGSVFEDRGVAGPGIWGGKAWFMRMRTDCSCGIGTLTNGVVVELEARRKLEVNRCETMCP